jgi:polyphosphate kinase 2 (PPK2 family)
MNIQTKEFQVPEGTTGDLNKGPTMVKALYSSKKQYKKCLNEHIEELSSLQRLLYASNRYALLLTFQAKDAAGKDSTI